MEGGLLGSRLRHPALKWGALRTEAVTSLSPVGTTASSTMATRADAHLPDILKDNYKAVFQLGKDRENRPWLLGRSGDVSMAGVPLVLGTQHRAEVWR